MEEYAMPSTGDPEEDARALEAFKLHDARISEGMCPNGCGPMDQVSSCTQECAACGFVSHRFFISKAK